MTGQDQDHNPKRAPGEGASVTPSEAQSGPAPTSTTARPLGLPIAPTSTEGELLAAVLGYYATSLKQSPAALGFLERRSLKSAEMIDALKLGFSDRSLGLKLPLKNRKAGKTIRAALARLGILKESGHERFRGAITVPFFDANGQLVQVYGRMAGFGLRPGVPLHLWLHEDRRGVWNLQAFGAVDSIIVTDSILNALTFWCFGHRNVTAVHGDDSPTDDLLAALAQHKLPKAVLAFRRTDEGEKAAGELTTKLLRAGVEVFRILLPATYDANDLARQSTDPAEAIDEAVRHAQWLGKGSGTSSPSGGAPPTPPSTGPAPDPAIGGGAPSDSAAGISEEHDEVVILQGDRRYRVRGLTRNLSFDQLRVNLLVLRSSGTQSFHVDVFDLYGAKARAAFIKQASLELGVGEEVIRHDLAKVLFRLEELQEQIIRKALEPEQPKPVELSEEEKAAALDLLRSPDLLQRILCDFEKCGVVGEADNKLVAYLAAVSRKLDEPLAVIVQSSSAAGKTSLMSAVLAFMPPEDRVEFSALTGQSLFYLRPDELRHKVLAIAEEEGAHRAAYALKLLQSERELTIGSTAKDPGTGRLVTQSYRVEGPVAVFTSTTAVEIDPELMNRCVVLSVDEDREQTRAIHRVQRERQTLEGVLAQGEREAVRALHRNAQRLLRPLLVVNPFAPRLSFLDDRTRTRRDHLKYLALIRAVTLLHQHQRPTKSATLAGKAVEYIEATVDDIAVANRLADKVLGRSLDDLPPHTRKLLVLLDEMVSAECQAKGVERRDLRFTRRQVRDFTGWGHTQLKLHMRRLLEMEYLILHRGGRGLPSEYELLWDGRGKDGEPVMAGLIDPEKLKAHQYDEGWSGSEAERSGSGRPSVGPWSAGGRGVQNGENPSDTEGFSGAEPSEGENTHPGGLTNRAGSSHTDITQALTAATEGTD